jgi:hypothetical protein
MWWLDGKMRLSVEEANTLFRWLAILAIEGGAALSGCVARDCSLSTSPVWPTLMAAVCDITRFRIDQLRALGRKTGCPTLDRCEPAKGFCYRL